MAETIGLILAAFALVFVINMIPAFMPATWMVLAFFYIQFDLPLLPLTIGGAVISGFGRLVLARGSTFFKRRFMSDKASDLDELGQFLEEHRKFLAPTVAAYALTPLPTNNLFIAAGMVEVNVAWVLAGFWVARIFADTLWVWTTNAAFENLGELFESAVTGPAAFALQLAGVVSIFLLYRLPWARWLRNVTSDSNAA